jgi:hypothetical protein
MSGTKVKIDRVDRDGWRFFVPDVFISDPYPTYPQAKRAAIAVGYEIDNAGWRHKLLSWQWYRDRCTTTSIVQDGDIDTD